MRVRLTRQAIRNLEDIHRYVQERNPSAAERVRNEIISGLDTLAVFPQAGRLQAGRGLRKLVVSRYGYVVYYRVGRRTEEVEILAIQHPARSRGHSDR